MRPSRIVFYGNFGAGNLGNEVTLQTAIEQTLARLPGAELLCVCTNPEDVRTRHGIAAAPAMSRDSGWSWRDLDVVRAPVAGSDTTPPGDLGARHGFAKHLARLTRIVFRRAPRELAHWYQMLRLMTRTDVLLVPGTGIVTDGSCGSFGWPYDMFKLAVLARLCGKQIVFLSVGAGPFRYRLGCWFIRVALRLAHYRSYRDADSRRRLEEIGFNTAGDTVYPDLVFGLGDAHLRGQPMQAPARRVVGLGLKDYAMPTDAADAGGYRSYLAAMADFVVWLQTQGFAVRLIIGDAQYDTRVREDLIALLEGRGAAATQPLLLSDPVPSVAELLRQLRETDAVVSPRFHNLVLALMLNKPVIALSDLPKVDALLSDLGLAQYCLPLADISSDSLIVRFAELLAQAGELKPSIESSVQKYRAALGEQYQAVLGKSGPLASTPPG